MKFIAKCCVVTSEMGILFPAPPQRSMVLELNFKPPYFPNPPPDRRLPSQILITNTRAT